MKKAIENSDVIVGDFYSFSPEQLEMIATRMRDAKLKRADPGKKIWIQAAPGLWFYHDPDVSRIDIERGFSVTKLNEVIKSPNGESPASMKDQAK